MKAKCIAKVIATACLTLITSLAPAFAQNVRLPHMDASGRFYVFNPCTPGSSLPYVPYGFMPKEASQMMEVDVTNHDDPFVPESSAVSNTNVACINVKITWSSPGWCGCAFISGPDHPAWWGADDGGWYYDLSGLSKKKLVFYARSNSEHDTRIQVKLGILADKSKGDSIGQPKESRWLTLSRQWTRYELDFSSATADQLSRICNGFTFVTAQDQNGGASVTDFSLSQIYFE